MYEEVSFGELIKMMELENDVELKHQWKHFYDTLNIFGLSICRSIENDT